MTGEQLLLVSTVAGAVVAGLLWAWSSSLSGLLARHLGTSEAKAKVLGAIFQLLLVPMMLVSGLLIDKWGPQAVLILGTLFTALALALFEFTRSSRRVPLAFLVLAIAVAGVSTASVVMMPLALYPRREAASTNLGFIAFTMGFLVAPGLTRLLQSQFGLRRSLQLLALICLVPALPAVLTPASAFTPPPPAAGAGNLLADPRLWLAALIALLYQPLESSLSAWTPAYLKELGFPQPTAPILWWSFWGVFLGARLLTAAFVQHGNAPWFILLLALLAAITLGNLVGAYRPASGGLGLLLVGLSFGPLLPTVVGLVLAMFPDQPGPACGVMLASGALGSLLFPPVIDAYARRTSARVAMRIPLGLALVIMGPALVLALLGSP